MPATAPYILIFEDNTYITFERNELLECFYDGESWIEFMRMAFSKTPYAAEMSMVPDGRPVTPVKMIRRAHCNSEPTFANPFGGTEHLPRALRE